MTDFVTKDVQDDAARVGSRVITRIVIAVVAVVAAVCGVGAQRERVARDVSGRSVTSARRRCWASYRLRMMRTDGTESDGA